MTRDECIDLIIQLEGGYVDDPRDPGGATKYGITQHTLDSIRIIHADWNLPIAIKDLIPATAATIYRGVQWVTIRGSELPVDLAPLMMNSAVNLGEPRAIMLLQIALGLHEDGILGPATLAKIKSWRSSYRADQSLAEEYVARIAEYYANRAGFENYGLGWLRRLIYVFRRGCSGITTV